MAAAAAAQVQGRVLHRLLLLLLLCLSPKQASCAQSFGIDRARDCFVKDGEPFRYIAGSLHYSRVPRVYWKDRLLKMYTTGLNAVQTYVPWNYHETKPGVFEFSGEKDLEEFIRTVKETGLLLILRPGPYICAEWDMGGLPAWLIQKRGIVLRSSDKEYLKAVDSWMSVLLPKVKPWLYQNGGPIITIQVENEYGSFGCDMEYMRHLTEVFRSKLGRDVVLFTTDEPSLHSQSCGSLQDLYSTIDFGIETNITQAFEMQRKFEPNGPLVNSEFYTGWLDYWGYAHSTRDSSLVASALDQMLSLGASVNMYMFEGGTNFGYWSGGDFNVSFLPVPTSYDYDAPLSEAGDPTEKLYIIRDVIRKYADIPAGPMPPPTPKYAYGYVHMTPYKNLTELLDILAPYGPVKSKHPLSFEEMNQGLLSGLILDGEVLTDWMIYSLDIDSVIAEGLLPSSFHSSVKMKRLDQAGIAAPTFYHGSFSIPPDIPSFPWDTFLKMYGWTKGQVWLNGFNLGRYWPRQGPQMTLYVPASLISASLPNNVTVLELEGVSCLGHESAGCSYLVQFLDRPILNGTFR
ncbi:beta-galactosidase-like isoform X4 [Petromyzon marinus]|uniref:beta-galactosidase-like isoform X4 n=1 Tax=Petromyzon marinus TaxID=7757 RepID=UPI003F6F701A